jgi:hypothetical protein
MGSLRFILLGALALYGLSDPSFRFAALIQPYVYHKDFKQEYFMARKLMDGVDPYLPLPELSAAYLGDLPRITLPHSNPPRHFTLSMY